MSESFRDKGSASLLARTFLQYKAAGVERKWWAFPLMARRCFRRPLNRMRRRILAEKN